MKKFRKNHENLDELLSKFYSSAQAEQMKEDFAAVDKLFEKFPAAAPSKQTIEAVKNKVAAKLAEPQTVHLPAMLLRTAAVAAIIVFAAVITTVKLKEPQQQYAADQKQVNLQQISIDKIDAEILLYENQITLLENELLAVTLNDEEYSNGSLLDRTEQAELEIIEINHTFWKG